jgi:hypothetical protein
LHWSDVDMQSSRQRDSVLFCSLRSKTSCQFDVKYDDDDDRRTYCDTASRLFGEIDDKT